MKKSDCFIEKEIMSYVHESGDFSKLISQIKMPAAPNKEPKNNFKKHLYWAVPALSCCLVFAICLPFVLEKNQTSPTSSGLSDTASASDYENIYVEISEEDLSSDTSFVLPWELKTNIQRYSSLNYLDSTYDVFNTNYTPALDENYLGSLIEEGVSISGFDIYEETMHSTLVDIYEIKNINQACALAIKFNEGDMKYYPYLNNSYQFNTLGEMIDKLNLKEYLTNKDFFLSDYVEYGDNAFSYGVNFVDSKEILWSLILNDSSLSLSNAYLVDKSTYSSTILSSSIDIDALGIYNVSIGLNKDGYIQTNILGVGKTFYIGTDCIQSIIDYVSNNYHGQRIIYYYELPTSEE